MEQTTPASATTATDTTYSDENLGTPPSRVVQTLQTGRVQSYPTRPNSRLVLYPHAHANIPPPRQIT